MSLEEQRLVLQTELDGQRSSEERNKEGQFATPTELARVVADYAVSLSPSEQVLRVLEPSCGSGAFINAILNALPNRPKAITGVEMDPRFALAARSLWQGQAEIVEDDFLEWIEEGDTLFDLIVANPPYVRHHHMSTDVKAKRNAQATKHTGISISKLAGLYVYFILASQRRLAPGAVATWLIPSEFMTVNYGSALRQFLSQSVTTVRVHTFDASEAQFDDALVTSCVVTYKNEVPNAGHEVLFTTGRDRKSVV
jgi:type I restriction-modification system DNA methylase subunit